MAAWVAAIATAVMAYVAVAEFNKEKPTDIGNSKLLPIKKENVLDQANPKSLTPTNTQEQDPGNEQKLLDKNSCSTNYEPMLSTIKNLSLRIDRDEQFRPLIKKAILDSCYKIALEAVSQLFRGQVAP